VFFVDFGGGLLGNGTKMSENGADGAEIQSGLRIISIFFVWSSQSSESGAAGLVILEGLLIDFGV
jgi:hypothetical protein